MEIVIIVLVGLAAAAAVLAPILRGGRERATRADDAAESQRPEAPDDSGEAAGGADLETDRDIEREVARYRTALRAGTVCPWCGEANPADARFCFRCGRPVRDEHWDRSREDSSTDT
jgi:hypothetical protein